MKEILLPKIIFALFMFFFWIIGELLIYPMNKWMFINRKEKFNKHKTRIKNGKIILVILSVYIITTKMENVIFAGMLVGLLLGFASMKIIFPLKYYYIKIRGFFTKNGKEKTE